MISIERKKGSEQAEEEKTSYIWKNQYQINFILV